MHIMIRRWKQQLRLSRRFRIFAFLFLLLSLLCFSVHIFRVRFMPIALAYAESRSAQIATTIIYEAISDAMADKGDYSSLYTITKNENEEITSIRANTAEINRLKAGLALEMQNRIEATTYRDIGIPIGSLSGNELLSGRGPLLPVRLLCLGSITIDVKSVFEEAGINQIRHSISLETKLPVSALLLGNAADAEIVTEVPVMETVIVGTVPESYTHVTGTEGSASDSVLNLLN